MKTFHDLLFHRRSIRKYTEQLLSPDDVKLIMEAGLVAPSSKGKMPWQFVVVDDKQKLEDASIAAFAMQLQAQDLGLGSCWIQIRDRFDNQAIPAEDNVKNLLDIPENMRVVCILSIGHVGEERKALEESKCRWEKVHVGSWRHAGDE